MDDGRETSRYFVPLDMFAGTGRLSNVVAAVAASLMVVRPARARGARRPLGGLSAVVTAPAAPCGAQHRASSSTAAGQAAHADNAQDEPNSATGARSHLCMDWATESARLARSRCPGDMTRSGKQSDVLGGLKAGPSVSASQHHRRNLALVPALLLHYTAWLLNGLSMHCVCPPVASASRRPACGECWSLFLAHMPSPLSPHPSDATAS